MHLHFAGEFFLQGGGIIMNIRSALVRAAVLTVLAIPAWGQLAGPAKAGAQGAAPTPDFSGLWNHPSFPWFEPPASGPGPITNRSRWPQQPSTAGGSVALPPAEEGVSDYDQLVGDHTNPILQPWAAEVVKKFGEMSLRGVTYPNPANQCWPEPMPFIFKQNLVQIIQQPEKLLLLYHGDHEVRRVRLNEPHPQPLTPSWYGDSVGHWEGDTLVIDTVGVKTDRPFAMIDLFGTPYSKSLHIVERYRLREYDDVRDAIERNKKENWLFQGDVFSAHRGKFLQVHVTIEDDGVFTTPWTATLTYIPSNDAFPEVVCSENQRWFPGTAAMVPRANNPDF
jgi:hypothetical protein